MNSEQILVSFFQTNYELLRLFETKSRPLLTGSLMNMFFLVTPLCRILEASISNLFNQSSSIMIETIDKDNFFSVFLGPFLKTTINSASVKQRELLNNFSSLMTIKKKSIPSIIKVAKDIFSGFISLENEIENYKYFPSNDIPEDFVKSITLPGNLAPAFISPQQTSLLNFKLFYNQVFTKYYDVDGVISNLALKNVSLGISGTDISNLLALWAYFNFVANSMVLGFNIISQDSKSFANFLNNRMGLFDPTFIHPWNTDPILPKTSLGTPLDSVTALAELYSTLVNFELQTFVFTDEEYEILYRSKNLNEIEAKVDLKNINSSDTKTQIRLFLSWLSIIMKEQKSIPCPLEGTYENIFFLQLLNQKAFSEQLLGKLSNRDFFMGINEFDKLFADNLNLQVAYLPFQFILKPKDTVLFNVNDPTGKKIHLFLDGLNAKTIRNLPQTEFYLSFNSALSNLQAINITSNIFKIEPINDIEDQIEGVISKVMEIMTFLSPEFRKRLFINVFNAKNPSDMIKTLSFIFKCLLKHLTLVENSLIIEKNLNIDHQILNEGIYGQFSSLQGTIKNITSSISANALLRKKMLLTKVNTFFYYLQIDVTDLLDAVETEYINKNNEGSQQLKAKFILYAQKLFQILSGQKLASNFVIPGFIDTLKETDIINIQKLKQQIVKLRLHQIRVPGLVTIVIPTFIFKTDSKSNLSRKYIHIPKEYVIIEGNIPINSKALFFSHYSKLEPNDDLYSKPRIAFFNDNYVLNIDTIFEIPCQLLSVVKIDKVTYNPENLIYNSIVSGQLLPIKPSTEYACLVSGVKLQMPRQVLDTKEFENGYLKWTSSLNLPEAKVKNFDFDDLFTNPNIDTIHENFPSIHNTQPEINLLFSFSGSRRIKDNGEIVEMDVFENLTFQEITPKTFRINSSSNLLVDISVESSGVNSGLWIKMDSSNNSLETFLAEKIIESLGAEKTVSLNNQKLIPLMNDFLPLFDLQGVVVNPIKSISTKQKLSKVSIEDSVIGVRPIDVTPDTFYYPVSSNEVSYDEKLKSTLLVFPDPFLSKETLRNVLSYIKNANIDENIYRNSIEDTNTIIESSDHTELLNFYTNPRQQILIKSQPSLIPEIRTWLNLPENTITIAEGIKNVQYSTSVLRRQLVGWDEKIPFLPHDMESFGRMYLNRQRWKKIQNSERISKQDKTQQILPQPFILESNNFFKTPSETDDPMYCCTQEADRILPQVPIWFCGRREDLLPDVFPTETVGLIKKTMQVLSGGVDKIKGTEIIFSGAGTLLSPSEKDNRLSKLIFNSDTKASLDYFYPNELKPLDKPFPTSFYASNAYTRKNEEITAADSRKKVKMSSIWKPRHYFGKELVSYEEMDFNLVPEWLKIQSRTLENMANISVVQFLIYVVTKNRSSKLNLMGAYQIEALQTLLVHNPILPSKWLITKNTVDYNSVFGEMVFTNYADYEANFKGKEIKINTNPTLALISPNKLVVTEVTSEKKIINTFGISSPFSQDLAESTFVTKFNDSFDYQELINFLKPTAAVFNNPLFSKLPQLKQLIIASPNPASLFSDLNKIIKKDTEIFLLSCSFDSKAKVRQFQHEVNTNSTIFSKYPNVYYRHIPKILSNSDTNWSDLFLTTTTKKSLTPENYITVVDGIIKNLLSTGIPEQIKKINFKIPNIPHNLLKGRVSDFQDLLKEYLQNTVPELLINTNGLSQIPFDINSSLFPSTVLYSLGLVNLGNEKLVDDGSLIIPFALLKTNIKLILSDLFEPNDNDFDVDKFSMIIMDFCDRKTPLTDEEILIHIKVLTIGFINRVLRTLLIDLLNIVETVSTKFTLFSYLKKYLMSKITKVVYTFQSVFIRNSKKNLTEEAKINFLEWSNDITKFLNDIIFQNLLPLRQTFLFYQRLIQEDIKKIQEVMFDSLSYDDMTLIGVFTDDFIEPNSNLISSKLIELGLSKETRPSAKITNSYLKKLVSDYENSYLEITALQATQPTVLSRVLTKGLASILGAGTLSSSTNIATPEQIKTATNKLEEDASKITAYGKLCYFYGKQSKKTIYWANTLVQDFWQISGFKPSRLNRFLIEFTLMPGVDISVNELGFKTFVDQLPIFNDPQSFLKLNQFTKKNKIVSLHSLISDLDLTCLGHFDIVSKWFFRSLPFQSYLQSLKKLTQSMFEKNDFNTIERDVDLWKSKSLLSNNYSQNEPERRLPTIFYVPKTNFSIRDKSQGQLVNAFDALSPNLRIPIEIQFSENAIILTESPLIINLLGDIKQFTEGDVYSVLYRNISVFTSQIKIKEDVILNEDRYNIIAFDEIGTLVSSKDSSSTSSTSSSSAKILPNQNAFLNPSSGSTLEGVSTAPKKKIQESNTKKQNVFVSETPLLSRNTDKSKTQKTKDDQARNKSLQEEQKRLLEETRKKELEEIEKEKKREAEAKKKALEDKTKFEMERQRKIELDKVKRDEEVRIRNEEIKQKEKEKAEIERLKKEQEKLNKERGESEKKRVLEEERKKKVITNKVAIDMITKKIQEMKLKLAEKIKQIEKVTEEKNQAEKEIEILKAEIDYDKARALEENKKVIFEEKELKLKQIEEKKKDTTERIESIKEKIEETKKKIEEEKQRQALIASNRLGVEDFTKKLNELVKRKDLLDQRIIQVSKDKTDLLGEKKKIEEQNLKNIQILDESRNLKQEKEDLEKTLTKEIKTYELAQEQAIEKKNNQETKLVATKEKIEKLKEKMDNLKILMNQKKLDNLETEITKLQSFILETEKRILELKKTLKDSTNLELTTLKEREQNLTLNVTNARQKEEEAKQTLDNTTQKKEEAIQISNDAKQRAEKAIQALNDKKAEENKAKNRKEEVRKKAEELQKRILTLQESKRLESLGKTELKKELIKLESKLEELKEKKNEIVPENEFFMVLSPEKTIQINNINDEMAEVYIKKGEIKNLLEALNIKENLSNSETLAREEDNITLRNQEEANQTENLTNLATEQNNPETTQNQNNDFTIDPELQLFGGEETNTETLFGDDLILDFLPTTDSLFLSTNRATDQNILPNQQNNEEITQITSLLNPNLPQSTIEEEEENEEEEEEEEEVNEEIPENEQISNPNESTSITSQTPKTVTKLVLSNDIKKSLLKTNGRIDDQISKYFIPAINRALNNNKLDSNSLKLVFKVFLNILSTLISDTKHGKNLAFLNLKAGTMESIISKSWFTKLLTESLKTQILQIEDKIFNMSHVKIEKNSKNGFSKFSLIIKGNNKNVVSLTDLYVFMRNIMDIMVRGDQEQILDQAGTLAFFSFEDFLMASVSSGITAAPEDSIINPKIGLLKKIEAALENNTNKETGSEYFKMDGFRETINTQTQLKKALKIEEQKTPNKSAIVKKVNKTKTIPEDFFPVGTTANTIFKKTIQLLNSNTRGKEDLETIVLANGKNLAQYFNDIKNLGTENIDNSLIIPLEILCKSLLRAKDESIYNLIQSEAWILKHVPTPKNQTKDENKPPEYLIIDENLHLDFKTFLSAIVRYAPRVPGLSKVLIRVQMENGKFQVGIVNNSLVAKAGDMSLSKKEKIFYILLWYAFFTLKGKLLSRPQTPTLPNNQPANLSSSSRSTTTTTTDPRRASISTTTLPNTGGVGRGKQTPVTQSGVNQRLSLPTRGLPQKSPRTNLKKSPPKGTGGKSVSTTQQIRRDAAKIQTLDSDENEESELSSDDDNENQ